MKGANFLEKLLDNQPVEWKKLGEVCEFQNGYAFKSSLFKETGLPIIRITNINGGGITDEDYKYFDPSDYPKRVEEYRVVQGDILVGMSGSIKIGWYDKENPAYLNQRVGRFIPKTETINKRFLYHYLRLQETNLYLMAGGGIQPNLSSTDIKRKLLIPIPPLSIQSRIVEILDKFTSLEAELEAELELRKKQYAYYREQLLNFSYTPPSEFNVVYRKLGEMAELVRGNGLSKKDFAPEGIPAIHYGQIYTYYGNETKGTISFVTPETASKLRKVFCGNVVITNTSENLEDVGKALLYSGESEAVTGGHATIIRCSEHLLPKYFVYYTMTYSFFDQKRKLAKGTKVIDVSATDLARIEIPLPPLSEQARIVEILDKFDTLTNSISEGLPLEIQLRRQQYEYYREQLLDFRRF